LGRRLYTGRKHDLLGRGRSLGLDNGFLDRMDGCAVHIHDLRLGWLDHPGHPEHSNVKNHDNHDCGEGKVYDIRDLHELF
jgi:hypothetical protein